MKRFLKIASVILGAFILLASIRSIAIVYLFSAAHPHTVNPIYSPDKSKVAIPTVSYDESKYDTYLLVHIEIQDVKSGEIIFQVLTRASDRMRWEINWVDNNTVRLDSSDIGIYCWSNSNGIWQKASCPNK